VEDLLAIEPEDLGLILVGMVRATFGSQRRNFTLSDFESRSGTQMRQGTRRTE
jgi:hypothetical protein